MHFYQNSSKISESDEKNLKTMRGYFTFAVVFFFQKAYLSIFKVAKLEIFNKKQTYGRENFHFELL